MSRNFKQLLNAHDIQQVITLPHDHHMNGLTERHNRAVLQVLRECQSERLDVAWWNLIKISEGVINRGYHRMLHMTPQEAWDLDENGRRALLEQQQRERSKRSGRRYVRKPNSELSVGTWVWVYQHEKLQKMQLLKLQSRWLGPCRIVERVSEHTWRVALVDGRVAC